MSHWNALETQLQSWTPRRPSPELKDKIFAAEQEEPRREVRSRQCGAPAFSWLAPAVACCLTLFSLVGANNLRFGGGDRRESQVIYSMEMNSLTPSNPATTFPAKKWFGLSATDENLEWNVWSKASFDWTNEGQFLSTNRSLQLARTNYLMR